MKKNIIIIIAVFIIITITTIISYNHNNSPFNYSHHGDLNEGIISVSDGKKYGYIKSNGKVIFRMKNSIKDIDNLSNLYFTDEIGTYLDGNLYGIINNKGRIIIKAKYSKIKIFNKNLILVQKDGNEYFINYKDKKISKNEYFEILYDDNENISSFIINNNNGLYGVIDKQGDIIIEAKYDNISKFYDKDNNEKYIYVTYIKDKINVFDDDGKKIELNNVSIISYYKDNKIYYKNDNGNIYIYDIANDKLINYKDKYEELFPFYDGIARVLTKDYKVGYINVYNNYVIEPIYQFENYSSDFKNKYAIASKKTDEGLKSGIIDKKGNVVIDFIYDEIAITKSEDKYIVAKENKYYIIDNKGTTISDKYDIIYETKYKGYYIVMLNKNDKELYGILDENLELIEDIKYSNVESYKDGLILEIDENKFKIIIK